MVHSTVMHALLVHTVIELQVLLQAIPGGASDLVDKDFLQR